VSAPAVEIDGLVKAYAGVRAVDGLSLTAAPAAVTAVLGPNGAGKTTVIECCEGLRTPDAGTVRVLGLDPVAHGPAVRAQLGVMLQDGGLPVGARAGAVLRHVAAMYAAPRPLAELTDRLGLTAAARTPVRRLSGGERQRLALACAVVGRPRLVFLDEPTAGLDPQARRAVWALVAELRADGVAVVLTTHLMADAEQLADHVVVVDHGRVIADGTPDGLLAGADHLEFSGPAGLGGALAARAGADVAIREPAPGRYVAEPREGRLDDARTAALLAALTGWAAEHAVVLSGFGRPRRTLEDLFLDLTGRALR
jgi:ABC-2 type transport system ATP-binding protein